MFYSDHPCHNLNEKHTYYDASKLSINFEDFNSTGAYISPKSFVK